MSFFFMFLMDTGKLFAVKRRPGPFSQRDHTF